MPARLADGLGPESDLANGSPPAFAPSAISRIWVPRADLQEGKPYFVSFINNGIFHWKSTAYETFLFPASQLRLLLS